MNAVLKTTLIVIVVLAVAGGLFFAGQAYARYWDARAYSYLQMPMMRGYGWSNNQPGYGPGWRTGGGMGPGMMNGYGYGGPANVQPLTVDEAKQAAQDYLQNLGVEGLEIEEVMIFDNNGYVAVKEETSGIGAFELLVDPVTKIAYPEYGPNMMWNLKYGGLNHQNMMGGRGGMGWMMGGWRGQNLLPAQVSAEMPVTAEQAIAAAQKYLDAFQPGAVAADDPLAFYGYYTLDFSQNGKIAGMLSVSGYNGQVFVHTWHGTFIEEWEAE